MSKLYKICSVLFTPQKAASEGLFDGSVLLSGTLLKILIVVAAINAVFRTVYFDRKPVTFMAILGYAFGGVVLIWTYKIYTNILYRQLYQHKNLKRSLSLKMKSEISANLLYECRQISLWLIVLSYLVNIPYYISEITLNLLGWTILPVVAYSLAVPYFLIYFIWSFFVMFPKYIPVKKEALKAAFIFNLKIALISASITIGLTVAGALLIWYSRRGY